MLDFQLYRFKVFQPDQLSLFDPEKTPSEYLREAITTKQSAELRKGSEWHVGNVGGIDDNGIYLRFGRTTKSTMQSYSQGNFVDQELETAPYTHVIVDVALEICAIAKRTSLAPETLSIARQLKKILNGIYANANVTASPRFELDPINDPEDFIAFIQKAYSVTRFSVTFSRPNLFDTNADFIKPLQNFAKASNGFKGRAEIGGINLDPQVLEDVTRSAAAAGEDVYADIKVEPDSKKTRKYLKGSPVTLKQEEASDHTDKLNLLQQMRAAWNHVRRKTDGSNEH